MQPPGGDLKERVEIPSKLSTVEQETFCYCRASSPELKHIGGKGGDMMSAVDIPNGLIERVLEAAPELNLSKDALDQTVSWSSEGAVSLGYYVSVRVPQLAHILSVEHKPDEPDKSVVPVDQLSNEDLKRVVRARLDEGTDDDTRLAVLGGGIYSIEDLKQEIDKETELGRRLLAAERRNIGLIERLAEAGKIRPSNVEPSIDVPEFEF